MKKIKEDSKEVIYLAGGCFWGVQEYFSKINGVLATVSGYANGTIENPSYEEVCSKKYGFAEAVKVTFDSNIISLEELLASYFKIIDPFSSNRQGPDVGLQYRTGIFYPNDLQESVINTVMILIQNKFEKQIMVEVKKLQNFYKAEEYHQDYLKKNRGESCSFGFSALDDDFNILDYDKYKKTDDDILKEKMTDLQYQVIHGNSTEAPFQNEYNDNYDKGIYVDVVTGEPLFTSNDKFDSSCGWPSFSKPIVSEVVKFKQDLLVPNRERIEVSSRAGNTHLGHVFEDGPKEKGGLRYCINSASIRFIPLEDMEKEGYKELIEIVRQAK